MQNRLTGCSFRPYLHGAVWGAGGQSHSPARLPGTICSKRRYLTSSAKIGVLIHPRVGRGGVAKTMTAYEQTPLRQHVYMNKRGNLRTYSIVGVIAVAYLSVVLLGCHLWRLGFVDCAYSFQSFHLVLFAPASLSFTAVSLAIFHKTRELRKTAITYTGIVATVVVLASFPMSQIASVTHDMAIFCLILITVWTSLSFKPLCKALRAWVIVAVFLATVMILVVPTNQALVLLLYALFSGQAALYATSVNRLPLRASFVTFVAILAIVGVMAYVAVAEWGMPPPGYEVLVAPEALDRAVPYADGIMIVMGGFFGLVPFVYLFTKNE